MRHSLKGRKLGRDTSARKALFKNLAISLVAHEQIVTTVPKAKELRSYMDKLITLSKKGDVASRRRAFALLRNKDAVSKLFGVFPERYKDRQGGYTRVLKAGYRHGDDAPIAVIELVDRDVEAKGKIDKDRISQQEGE